MQDLLNNGSGLVYKLGPYSVCNCLHPNNEIYLTSVLVQEMFPIKTDISGLFLPKKTKKAKHYGKIFVLHDVLKPFLGFDVTVVCLITDLMMRHYH